MATMNLLWEYGLVNPNEKHQWCRFYGIFPPRIKRLESTSLNLSRRVADFLGISDGLLKITTPPSQMPHSMITVLRIIQVWVFHQSVVQCNPASLSKGQSREGLTLVLQKKSDRIEKAHLDQVLNSERHPFLLKGHSEIRQKGTFDCSVGGETELNDSHFAASFEIRFLSYSTEKGYTLAWVYFADYMTVYVREEVARAHGHGFGEEIPMLKDCLDASLLVAKLPSSKARRGRAERPSGMWTIHTGNERDGTDTPWLRFCFLKNKAAKKKLEKLESELENFIRKTSLEGISFQFPDIDKARKTSSFTLVARGSKKGVSDVDLRDLLASTRVQSSTKKSFDQQQLVFPFTHNSPLAFNGRSQLTTFVDTTTSWDRPVVKCIPEGVRLLSVLASGRRREHVVRLLSMEDTTEGKNEGDELLDLHLDPKLTNISHRWKRFNTNLSVYVETNSVPASAVPMSGSEMMYCCCANTLELRGGGIKAGKYRVQCEPVKATRRIAAKP